MLRQNDKITLTIQSAINKKGEFAEFSGPNYFSSKEKWRFESDTIQVSVVEYQEGPVINMTKSFNIYVGKYKTFDDLFDPIVPELTGNVLIMPGLIKDIEHLSNLVAYYEDDFGRKVVFAKVRPGDIVVDNIPELIFVIEYIMKQFRIAKQAIGRIQGLSTIKNVEGPVARKRKKHEDNICDN